MTLSSRGRAEDGAVSARLDWTREAGGESCLGAPDLEHAVERRWSRRIFVETPNADILLEGRIGPLPGGKWSARLELRRADGSSIGSRELVTRAVECSALDDSVALAVGLMLDFSRRQILDERRARAESAAPERAPPSLSGPPIAVPDDTLPSRVRVHVEPTVAAETALGLLPSLAVAFRGALAVDVGRFFRLDVAASLFASQRPDAEGRGADVGAWTIQVMPCPIFERRRTFGWDACLVQRAGDVQARGFGFDTNASPHQLFASAGLAGDFRYVLAGPLALAAGIGVEIPYVRYRFAYVAASSATASVYEMAPVLGSAWLGLSARF